MLNIICLKVKDHCAEKRCDILTQHFETVCCVNYVLCFLSGKRKRRAPPPPRSLLLEVVLGWKQSQHQWLPRLVCLQLSSLQTLQLILSLQQETKLKANVEQRCSEGSEPCSGETRSKLHGGFLQLCTSTPLQVLFTSLHLFDSFTQMKTC